MPTVINGIGTWYYGKRRIHTIKDTCEFCNRRADLVSYDTTLFFVVVFVPVIPLQRNRILRQCTACQKHRVISLAKWEKAKKQDGDALLERLRRDPDDRDAVVHAIGFATAYQDEPLFDKFVETLAGHRTGDAAIQAQLGNAYSYFSRWPEAERAYRAALAAEDNEFIREQLAETFLKQNLPEEARPYLQHIIDTKKRDSAGMVYLLVKGYQAQGRHEEALEIMDERDRAFPDWVDLKEYRQQRKTSLQYQGTNKKVRSALLDPGKGGYREGNWTARMPLLIALMVVLGAIGLYFGSAAWIGQSRKVYLVNGTNQPYAVVVEGKQHTLAPNSSTPLRIAEGDVQVAFADANLGLEPVQCRIATIFWSRPFDGTTFIINPDQSAVVLEEEAYYAKDNPPAGAPPRVHFGRNFYTMSGIDYEFENFPPTLTVKGNVQTKKTRVGLEPGVVPEERLFRRPRSAKSCCVSIPTIL
jgi:tetratricopeptide (TPR) repeat protein